MGALVRAQNGSRSAPNGEPGGDVRERCRATPPDAPFIIHVGEGIDAAAAAELPRLEASGCVWRQHGDRARRRLVARELAAGPARRCRPGLVPGVEPVPVRTHRPGAGVPRLGPHRADHVCLGSDSRLTGARDLLDELHVAATAACRPRRCCAW